MRINCSINGKPVRRSDAKISVFDNSIFYADGLFETFMAINDNVIFLEDHLDRLEKGAELIGILLPISRNKLRQWINDTNRSNKSPIKKIRVTITAGDSSFWAGEKSKPRVIIIVTEFEYFTKPFRLTVAPFRVDQKNPFRNVKTLSFIIEMTSRKRVYASHFDDGILLNRAGYVAETTSANIFWVKNNILYTTPLSAGCLDGMTRKHILALAKMNGIKTRIQNIKMNGLIKADEVFITSSLKLIIPVSLIHYRVDQKFKTGPITKKLKKILLDYIN
jgi:branched-subunit amino acid aminotransferase/4-amino-4-deoxychorismate lyase